MKTFNPKMAVPNKGPLTCEFNGEPTKFPLNELSFDELLNFRTDCVKRYDSIQGEKDLAKGFELAFMMRIDLVQLTIKGSLDKDQAGAVLTLTGGLNGKLINALIERYGLQDLFDPKKKGGNLEAEIPI